VTLDGRGSKGNAPRSCVWSFENQDGSMVWGTQSGCLVDRTFLIADTKYVKLTVTDADGDVDANRKSFMVSQTAPAPMPTPIPLPTATPPPFPAPTATVKSLLAPIGLQVLVGARPVRFTVPRHLSWKRMMKGVKVRLISPGDMQLTVSLTRRGCKGSVARRSLSLKPGARTVVLRPRRSRMGRRRSLVVYVAVTDAGGATSTQQRVVRVSR
jgi:hypothetical protein